MADDFLKLLTDELRGLASRYIDDCLKSATVKSISASEVLNGNAHVCDFKIGSLLIGNPVISAPLAGISDNTYRIFARAFGCSLTFSEMVTGYGIHFNNTESMKMTNITEYERPCALQLFGSEPEIMADAAQKAAGRGDMIDINMGCPVPKILKAKSGGYLMQDEKRAGEIISRIADACSEPLTVKTRIGWDRNNINILNIARIAEDCGVQAITIHGRTVRQGFSGKADYEMIKKVREAVSIPVIASGDIKTPEDVVRVLEYTGCQGVMVGRAAKGALWLFSDILISLILKEKGLKADFMGSIADKDWKKRFALLYLKFLIHFKGEYKAVREFRKHLSWIFKGVRDISRARKRFFMIENAGDAAEIIDSI